MKIKRIFEEGDVVVCTQYNHVLIRVRGERGFRSSNSDHYGAVYFTDAQINEYLDNGAFAFMGNRFDFVKPLTSW